MERNVLNFHSKYDQISARDYCDSHEQTYSNHKIKPDWCGDCGYLKKYVVIIDHSKESHYKEPRRK